MIKIIKDLFAYYRSTEARWFIYLNVAFLMTLSSELSKYDSFADIPGIKLVLMFIAASIQALIAWRAFIDQSISRSDVNTSTSTTVSPTSGS